MWNLGLYRGCIPTAAGVAPFVALNFALYERFRLYALPPELEETVGEGQSVATKLACGALAGGLSQTITYPFDVIRRKMQVSRSQCPRQRKTS
jgi:solute carrier family 25 phosphate transporter 23/24/25/41